MDKKVFEITETIGEFLERACSDDQRIVIRANDMLPRKGTKASLKGNSALELWFGGYEFQADGSIEIQGLFNRY